MSNKETTDWSETPMYDPENHTRINAICSNGHVHTNRVVAKYYAHPGTVLPTVCSAVAENPDGSLRQCGAQLTVLQ